MEPKERPVAEPTLANDVPTRQRKPKLCKVFVKKFQPQKNPRTLQHWEREVEALRHVGTHANIVQITHSDAVSLTITLRWAAGHSLDHFIKSDTRQCTLPRDDARLLWKQMSSALAYTHSKSITHDDVKPHNIVWDEQLKHAVLIDFGAALVNPESLPEGGWTSSGTPSYAPPEFFEKKCQAGDVWALGVTMLFAFGDIPLPDGSWILPRVFENEDVKDEMMQWLLRIESLRKSSDHAGDRSLLAPMLHWSPEQRISSDDLVRHLEA